MRFLHGASSRGKLYRPTANVSEWVNTAASQRHLLKVPFQIFPKADAASQLISTDRILEIGLGDRSHLMPSCFLIGMGGSWLKTQTIAQAT